MKKLVSVENLGNLTHKTWQHTGDNGQMQYTVQTQEDAAPVIQKAKHLAQTSKGKDFKYLASIPENTVNQVCYTAAKVWGVSAKEAYQEFVSGKTDRAKLLWKNLVKGRDYRKLQASHYT